MILKPVISTKVNEKTIRFIEDVSDCGALAIIVKTLMGIISVPGG